jgi:hypothetical protein
VHLKDYTAVIHFHSDYSFDGRTSIRTILDAARKNRVDVLMLTDHSTLRAREDGFEGWHQGILLIVGEEIAPRFNHYLAFGHRQAIACAEKEPDLSPQTYIDRVRAGGGMGFIAHPDHTGTPLFHVKHYPWTDWSVTGYTGMGIWDFMTDWQNSLFGHIRAIMSYTFPAFFLCGPSPVTLAHWDCLTQERHVVGIGELDNHDSLRRYWGMNIPVFPFSRILNLIRTHILLDRPLSGVDRADINTILAAIRRGRIYVSCDYFQPAHGFSLILVEENRKATMGDDFALNLSAELSALFPYRARIRLIRNGKIFRQVTAKELCVNLSEPGVYRIEADLMAFGRYRPWIFSNPIYINRTSEQYIMEDQSHGRFNETRTYESRKNSRQHIS